MRQNTMLALTSATGKLGSAVLNAILDNELTDPKNLVVCTSSDPQSGRFDSLRQKGVTIRYNNFDEPSSLESAYSGCTQLFLVSTARVSMDYNNAPLWEGREAHHRAAIDAAIKVNVQHVYYTSLAFSNPSKAGVMRAHIRTEKYLNDLAKQGKLRFTIIREGLYNESWPLYFGYFDGLKKEERREVVVAGDGPISWTAITDMAFATAKVLTTLDNRWENKTFYLAQNETSTLEDIAQIVSRIQGHRIVLKVASKEEYENHYIKLIGMEKPAVEWWSSTYDALNDGECDIKDTTLTDILHTTQRTPVSLRSTIEHMMR